MNIGTKDAEYLAIMDEVVEELIDEGMENFGELEYSHVRAYLFMSIIDKISGRPKRSYEFYAEHGLEDAFSEAIKVRYAKLHAID